MSDFLEIPDGNDSPEKATHECPLDAGPVIFRMVSYLGAFPFQNTLAPSVLTFEAMVKVVVLLTERYGKVLKRGRRDRIKLLFGSLADVGRKDVGADKEVDDEGDKGTSSEAKSHAPGFTIDEPVNDEYDEDDDDLALAALESLDAIEVFKHDRRIDKTMYEAQISVDTFRRLLMLLLVIAPLKPLESVSKYTMDLTMERVESARKAADNILAAFIPDGETGGITYQSFAETVSSALPYLFDPLTPLFEHLLFSTNLNLSQRRDTSSSTTLQPAEKLPDGTVSPPSPIMLRGSFETMIMNPSVVSYLSFFLPSTSSEKSLINGGVRLHPVFSTAAHGSSLTSFSHHVITWQSPTLLILQGAITNPSTGGEKMITLGAYLPHKWKSSGSASSASIKPSGSTTYPLLFQLSPNHLLLPGNTSPSAYQPNTPEAFFSTHTGLSIGCQIPPSSRSNQSHPTPRGAGSLLIDRSMETATFHVAPVGHDGIFQPPSALHSSKATKTDLDIYTLEVWGIVPDPEGETLSSAGQSAVDVQREKWEFEAREAERRRNVNFRAGGEASTESARWLLESAGIIGGSRGGGGSV